MKKEITFMLDMDGVCCDWLSPALKLIGREDLINNWEPGVANIEDMAGLSKPELWTEIEGLGSKWWRDLEEFPWFFDLHKMLSDNGKVVFCTSPNLDPSSLKGKVGWIQDRFGKFFRDYIITNKKHYCAGIDTVLVDDNDKQCHKFVEHNGEVILFPQLWNATAFDKKAQEDKMGYVENRIAEILDGSR